MNYMTQSFFAFALCLVAGSVTAATEQISTTNHNVTVTSAEKYVLPDGRTAMANERMHGTIINDATGEISSAWCVGGRILDAKGTPIRTSGSCTVFYDSGDTLEYAFGGTTMDQPGTWTVTGGTGKYAGATGGGTFSVTSQRSDGFAWTTKGTGTITTK